MGASTIENNSALQEQIAAIIANTGYNIEDLAAYFRSKDTGNGFFKSGRNDGKLTGDELARTFIGLAEAAAKRAGVEDAMPQDIKDLITNQAKSLPKEAAPTIDEIIEVMKNADKNQDGHLSAQELGVDPKMIQAAVEASGEVSR